MAEVAAGALVAEQVISTTIEGGIVAGVALSRRTMPLKATFTRIAVSDVIRRHSHSINVVDGKAYIFGGITEDGFLAGNEMHLITLPPKNKNIEGQTNYQCLPALGPSEDSPIPSPRAGHSACVSGNRVLIWGGRDAEGHSVSEPPSLWIFDTTTQQWTALPVKEGPADSQFYHGAALTKNKDEELLLLYAGFSRPSASTDLRTLPCLSAINTRTGAWTSYGDQRVSRTTAPSAIVAVDGTVYTVGGNGINDNNIDTNTNNDTDTNTDKDTDTDKDTTFQAPIHFYNTTTPTANHDPAASSWQTLSIPANPLVPGPTCSRDGAALHVLETGHGRRYLLYMMGQQGRDDDARNAVLGLQRGGGDSSNNNSKNTKDDSNEDPTFFSDLWTLQLPSARPSLSGLKDSARTALGADSGCGSWAEVEVLARPEEFAHEGKAHPGPRSFFGSAVVGEGEGAGRKVVVWGGVNPRGEVEGDGWVVGFE